MPKINMHVDFDDVPETDFTPVPSGTYEFQVRDIELRETSDRARPMLLWWLAFLNEPELNNRQLPYNTVLPWEDPEKPGDIDTSGCGLLTAIRRGVRKPWIGQEIDTDDYIGATGMMSVGQGTIGKGPRKGEPTNTVKIVVPAERLKRRVASQE